MKTKMTKEMRMKLYRETFAHLEDLEVVSSESLSEFANNKYAKCFDFALKHKDGSLHLVLAEGESGNQINLIQVMHLDTFAASVSTEAKINGLMILSESECSKEAAQLAKKLNFAIFDEYTSEAA